MSNEVAPAMPATVQVFEGNIGGVRQLCVDARELWQVLASKQMFAHWARARITRSRLRENRDWTSLDKVIKQNVINPGRGGINRSDYLLSLDAAKFIGMMENSPAADALRLYFLDCERRLFSGQGAPAPAAPDEIDKDKLIAEQEWVIYQLRCLLITSKRAFMQIKSYRNKGLGPHQVALLCGMRISTLTRHCKEMLAVGLIDEAFVTFCERLAVVEAKAGPGASDPALRKAYRAAVKEHMKHESAQMSIALDNAPNVARLPKAGRKSRGKAVGE